MFLSTACKHDFVFLSAKSMSGVLPWVGGRTEADAAQPIRRPVTWSGGRAALNAFKDRDLLTMNLDNEPALSAEPLPCRHLTAEGTNHQKRLLDPLPRDGPCTLLVSSAGTLLLAIPGMLAGGSTNPKFAQMVCHNPLTSMGVAMLR